MRSWINRQTESNEWHDLADPVYLESVRQKNYTINDEKLTVIIKTVFTDLQTWFISIWSYCEWQTNLYY